MRNTDNSLACLSRMERFISENYLLNRIPVGVDADRFVDAICRSASGAAVLSIPSFTECLTWVIPPAWTVREGYVETLSGKRIADFKWHPLYLKSYAVPFEGEVSQAELVSHILTDEKRPDCLIYDFRSQYQFDRKDWGFSLPYREVAGLEEDRYRVKIDVAFEAGDMKIVDLALPGATSETIFFAAHTCHPGQVNDGIGCIAVLLELFKWLEEITDRRYTYRLILGPEYFAAAGLLARGADVDSLKMGFYLDMVCNGKQAGFAHSYQGDSYADRVTHNVMEHAGFPYLRKEYRGLWGNDEMFYDGPGFQIPTICIGRDRFDYYHTDKDNLENCDRRQLTETLDLLKRLVKIFENDCVPQRLYKGPLYLSKYDLYIDPRKDRRGQRSLQEIQILMDGNRSCLDIAQQLGVSFEFVRAFIAELARNNLVRTSRKMDLR